jgi:transposase
LKRTYTSEREVRRAAVFSRVVKGGWTLLEAAERMEVSYRQAKRLWKRYGAEGAAGLVHRSAGRVSNRAKPRSLRRTVLGLMGKKYGGEPGERFGPTLAVEHLGKEDGIRLGVERLRKWMLEEGLWSRERRRRAHGRRRERKAHFGELVQLDGSFHDWLEGRGPRGCLMNRVDDATGRMLCRMAEEEDHLGGGGSAEGVDGALRGAASAVHGLEERACARAQGE